MKLLIILDKYFYDGHGSSESGNERIYLITDREIFKKYNGLIFRKNDCSENLIFHSDEEIQMIIDDYEEPSLRAEDGYSCSVYHCEVKEITDEQEEYVKKVINEYLIIKNEYYFLSMGIQLI